MMEFLKNKDGIVPHIKYLWYASSLLVGNLSKYSTSDPSVTALPSYPSPSSENNFDGLLIPLHGGFLLGFKSFLLLFRITAALIKVNAFEGLLLLEGLMMPEKISRPYQRKDKDDLKIKIRI
ncbi:hypothetical protein Tco_0695054 [Tanacetum coccineum]